MNHLVTDGRDGKLRQFGLNLVAITNGIDTLDAQEVLHCQDEKRHEDDGIKGTWNLIQSLNILDIVGEENDDQNGKDGDEEVPKIESLEVLEIADPLADEVTRCLERSHHSKACVGINDNLASGRVNDGFLEAKHITHLCRKNG